MSPDERRTIVELAARYELEPTLRDVYVEGAFDVAVVGELLARAGCNNAAVYEIDTVEVPTEALVKHGLADGNKGRVIALCLELAAHLSPAEQVTGLVDRDYDTVLGLSYPCPLLLFTDFSCMEMYFFDRAHLERFCTRFLRKGGDLAGQLIEMLTPVLQELFFIRSTNESLKLSLTWLESEDQCAVRRGQLEFDPDAFVHKYLSKGSQLSEKERFVSKRDEIRGNAAADVRHQMHGHDFVRLMAKCLHPVMRNASFSDPDVVERALPAWADYEVLQKANMFKALISRVA